MTRTSSRRGVAAMGLAAVVLATTTAGASAAPAPATLREIVQELVEAGSPGGIVGVRAPTSVRRAVAGLASLRPRSAMRATDRYRVGSVTKSFVATIVLQLAAEGR